MSYRLTINRYAQTVETCINELTSLEIDRKDSNFSSLWIGEFRERVDTKDNK